MIRGACDLDNVNQGRPATINCRASTVGGSFTGTFVTDGSAPRLAQQ
jgi:hypothetical protein